MNRPRTGSIICILSIVVLFASHLLQLPILVIMSVGIMCGGILFLNDDQKLSILFCCIPWIQVFKLHYSQPSLYYILYFVFCITIITNKKFINYKLIISVLIFIIYILVVRLINQVDPDYGIIGYIISIGFMILLYPNLNKYYNSILCINMLSFGLISGFIAERIFRYFFLMGEYLSNDKYSSSMLSVRFAGLMNDSNYMAMQVLLYLCLVLSILKSKYNEPKVKARVIIESIVVLVFSFFTVSKMLYLGLAIIIIHEFWLSLVRLRLGRFVVIISMTILFGYLFNFFGFFDPIVMRIGSITDIDSLTTGRFGIFQKYINYLLNNPKVLFFGIGMRDRQYYQGISTHNTLISMLYQLGLVGLFFVYSPMLFGIVRSISISPRRTNYRNGFLGIIILGLCILSLDMLMYLGLPIIIILAISSSL